MKIGFHGTSQQAAERILVEGYKPQDKNWTIASNNCYVFHGKDNHEAMRRAFNQAMSSAMRWRFCRRSVIAINLDGLELKPDPDCVPDYAWEITSPWNKDRIVGRWTDVYELSSMKPMMKFIMDSRNQIHSTSKIKLTPLQKIISENMAKFHMNPTFIPIKENYRNHQLTWSAPRRVHV